MHMVFKEDRIPEAQISSLVLSGHVQLSTNNSSGDSAAADVITLCEQGQNSRVTKLLGSNDIHCWKLI